MLRYKIGELTALLGIPPETIRFYERKGLIKPIIDEKNRYRYFGLEDFIKLLILKSLRGFEFTLDETLSVMGEPSAEQRIAIMKHKKAKYQEQIEKYHRLTNHADGYISALENAVSKLWQCEITQSPPMYSYIILDNQYLYDGTLEINALAQKWLSYSPYVHIAFEFSKEDLIKHNRNKPFRFGFSIFEHEAIAQNVDIGSPVKYHPGQMCVYTVFCIDKNEHPFDHLDYLFEYIADRSFNVAGDALGHLIYQSYKDSKPIGYYQLWIPIE